MYKTSKSAAVAFLIIVASACTNSNNSPSTPTEQSTSESGAASAKGFGEGTPGDTRSEGRTGGKGMVALQVSEGMTYVANGFLHVLGTVQNNSGQNLESIRYEVSLYDQQGKMIRAENFIEEELRGECSDQFHGEVASVEAGGQAPFLYLRDQKRIQGAYASHKILAFGRPAKSLVKIMPGEVKSEKEGSDFSFSGTVNASGNAHAPNIVAAGFDAQGRIVALSNVLVYQNPNSKPFDPVLEDIAPSQKGHFNGRIQSPTDDGGKVLAEIKSLKFFGSSQIQ
jgi:hypothetical protein